MKKTIKAQQAALFAEILPLPPSKGQRRQQEIVLTAIRIMGRQGWEKSTFDAIAKACKVSRPLIAHYFTDQRTLLKVVARYIRANFQHYAIERIRAASSPREALVFYVESTFDWVREFRDEAVVWALFLYHCGIDTEMLELHSRLVAMGEERIVALLLGGTQAGMFQTKDPSVAAKMIQTVITGALIHLVSELSPIPQRELRQQALDLCLHLAGATPAV